MSNFSPYGTSFPERSFFIRYCDGIINGPLVALMDDSVPAGYRSEVETLNRVVSTAASAVGPLVAGAMFMSAGNDWDLSSMKLVIILGCIIGQLSNIAGVMMDDSKALGMESEAVHLQVEQKSECTKEAEEKAEEGVAAQSDSESATCFGLLKPSSVVYVMFASNLFMSLGGGMTIKFFPVFFQQDGHVSPALLNTVFSSLNLFTIAGTLLAQKAGKRFGRLEVVVPGTALAVLATFLLGALRPFYQVPAVMLPLFVIRCTVLWSIAALKGSIVADYTPKAQRGKWKALNSIASAGWSGSAAVGVWLIDHYGYGICFIITACFQALAVPLLAVLMPHVAKETDIAIDSVTSLKSPLLARTPEHSTPILRSPAPGPMTMHRPRSESTASNAIE